jgi:Domain of unknown function (DUF4349)
MRILPFPDRDDLGPEENWLAELDAALSETAKQRRAGVDEVLSARAGEDPHAASWRELRDDVRTLAPPISPEFERELGERIAEWSARSAVGQVHRPQQSHSPKLPHRFEGSRRPGRPHRRLGWLRPTPPRFAALSVAFAVIAAVLIAAPWRPAGHTVEKSQRSSSLAARADEAGPAFGPAESAPATGARTGKASSSGAPAGGSAFAGSATNAPDAGGAASAPGRVQQLSASISLTAIPDEVQTVADRVSRLAVSEGGFVQSSHVNEGEKTGEASLTLNVPSAKLSAALASLGQLAPVRAESQSLQDITNTYDEDRQRLNEATAERRALLRALAQASTEGEIDSLRARLAQNGGTLARARATLGTVAKQASTAEVEVTVVGDKSVGSEGLTLHRGLHDAVRVLTVTLVILLIAAAVLVPLGLLAIALATAKRAWLQHRRERVLDGG